MAGLIPSVGCFGQASAWGLFVFLAVWHFLNVAPNAECANHIVIDSEEGLQKLFEQASPSEPVQVEPFQSQNAALHKALQLIGEDAFHQEQAPPAPEPVEANDASFIAKSKTLGPLGFLLGHVEKSTGVLDSLSILTQTNAAGIVTSLGNKWFKSLEERGATEVRAQTLASDIDQLNQLQMLGFFPTGVSHGSSSAFKAVSLRARLSLMGMGGALTAKDSQILWKLPLPYENGSSTYVYERITELRDLLIPRAKMARKAAKKSASTDEVEKEEKPEAAGDETSQPTEAAKGEKSQRTEAVGDARFHYAKILLDELSDTDDDESDETGTTKDDAKQETETPASVEGKPFVPEELELVEYTEENREFFEELVKKAGEEETSFAAELGRDNQHVFMVKTKGESKRLKGLAVAKVVPEQNLLLVSRIHVGGDCDGNAMLLLAKAISDKAFKLDVESTLMYIPTSAVSSWNSASQVGFTVRNYFKGSNLPSGRNRQKVEDTFELHLDRTTRPQDSYTAYLEMEQLEYQLEQLINSKPKGLKCVTASEEDASYLLQRTSSKHTGARKVRDSDSAAVTGIQWQEGLMLIGTAMLVHLLLVGLIRSYESYTRRHGKQYSGMGTREGMQNETMIAQWDWQPAPTSYEEERSSELDEFYVDTLVSDSFAPGTTVSP